MSRTEYAQLRHARGRKTNAADKQNASSGTMVSAAATSAPKSV